MNSEVKAQWVAALRSGEYQQGEGALRRGDNYCCLGVLCDLAVKAALPITVSHGHEEIYYDGYESLPPDRVQQWAGLERRNPQVTAPDGCVVDLASLNDSGHYEDVPWSFDQIADIIEAQL